MTGPLHGPPGADQLPLRVERRRRICAVPDAIWAICMDEALLPRWVDGVDSVEYLSGADVGRRVRVKGSQVGVKTDAIQVIDALEQSTLMVFHLEDLLVGGKPVEGDGATRQWLQIEPREGYSEVVLGVGYQPASRLKAMQLRATLPLLGRQYDRTLGRLEALVAETAVNEATAAASASRPARPEPLGPSKRLQAVHLAASVGSRMQHPGVRGASQLTLKAIDWRMSKRATASAGEILGSNGELDVQHVSRMVESVNRCVKQQPPRQMLEMYGEFATALGLVASAFTFSIGAAHLGYAVRRAEEETLAGASASVVPVGALMASLRVDRALDDATILYRTASAYACHEQGERVQLDVMRLPPGTADERGLWRDSSLNLLTKPGADFRQRPSGITHDQTLRSWSFGFALRCAEKAASVPDRTNRLIPSALLRVSR